MGGSFACPECGNPLELKGQTPGRQVRCGWCRTWVEVPFLPRAARRGSFGSARRRKLRWPAWAWGGLILAAVLLLLAGASRRFRAQARQVHEQELGRLSAEAQCEERAGRLGPALAAIEAALVVASKTEPRDDARRGHLRAWRDRVASREVEARLAEVTNLPPERAVGACLTLLSRARDNPGLGGFQEAIGVQLDRARGRWVEADLADARRALEANDADRVLVLCKRLVETAETLTNETRRRARDEADALVTRIVTQRGVILDSIRGQFVLGSHSSYDRTLHPLLADKLRRHGYLPRPAASPWGPLWDTLAPFHLTIGVVETLPGTYEASQNRISAIDVSLALQQQGKARAIWERTINAQTRTPLPKLPAYQASRLATSDHRNPDIEHMLYEDARSQLVERLGMQLRSLPENRAPLAPPTTSASRS